MPALRKLLSEQVMVITGATSGVGLATAKAAAAAGARLVISARNTEALTALTAALAASGARVAAVAGDIADEATARTIADAADLEFGGFDTWVNNAGVSIYGRSWDVPLADQRRLFETNYWGAVQATLTAVARLRARPGGGTIINVGSVLSDQAIPLQGAYCASKHALKAFTNALRMELMREAREVQLTLIKPSALDTPYKQHARNYLGHAAGNPPPIYDPALVARAILYAAENPVREITVGGGGRLMALFGQLLPRLAEPFYAIAVPVLSRDRTAEHIEDSDALHLAGRDLAEHVTHARVRTRSLWTEAQLNPRATAAVVGASLAGAMLLLKLRDGLRMGHARRQGRQAALDKIARQQAVAKRQAA